MEQEKVIKLEEEKKKADQVEQGVTPRLLALVLCLAEVIAEVKIAGGFGDRRGRVRNGDVLQVQEAELDLHGEENLQLTAHGLAAHLLPQQNVQSVRPQAKLRER